MAISNREDAYIKEFYSKTVRESLKLVGSTDLNPETQMNY